MSKPHQRNHFGSRPFCGSLSRVILAMGSVFAGCGARAEQVVSCGGFAMLGGAQINCSHMVQKAPTQVCTFSWTLMTAGGAPDIVEGSFLLPPGSNNVMVYQAAGFSTALSNPIVLCQGKKSR